MPFIWAMFMEELKVDQQEVEAKKVGFAMLSMKPLSEAYAKLKFLRIQPLDIYDDYPYGEDPVFFKTAQGTGRCFPCK